MGYMRHHAIVVTGLIEPLLRARIKAMEIFPAVSPAISGAVNDYHSFFIPSDGSKEGWRESDHGDNCRDQFIAWLQVQQTLPSGVCLSWVEVQYGDDNGETKIVRHSDGKPGEEVLVAAKLMESR